MLIVCFANEVQICRPALHGALVGMWPAIGSYRERPLLGFEARRQGHRRADHSRHCRSYVDGRWRLHSKYRLSKANDGPCNPKRAYAGQLRKEDEHQSSELRRASLSIDWSCVQESRKRPIASYGRNPATCSMNVRFPPLIAVPAYHLPLTARANQRWRSQIKRSNGGVAARSYPRRERNSMPPKHP